MARRWLALMALGLMPGDCAGAVNEARPIETTHAACAVGERPGYFVPGPPDGPLALLGCARLGVSGKRIEFSANLADIDGDRHACVNPAYSGRGQRGFFIPALCELEPPLSRFAVRDARQPRQGVRGYAYVIWGTAVASTAVAAHFTGGTAQAAVMRVDRDLARRFGESPFSLFVVELPISAACAVVTVVGNDTERIPPRRRLCDRAPRATMVPGDGGRRRHQAEPRRRLRQAIVGGGDPQGQSPQACRRPVG